MALLLLLGLSIPLTSASPPPSQNVLSAQMLSGASIENARGNANLVFNAVHSSMRQWGSSIQHNGMSFFPAYVPEGTLLYHGRGTPGRVRGIEWLAFEIQHAEMFARRMVGRPSKVPMEPRGELGEEYLEEIWDPRSGNPMGLWEGFHADVGAQGFYEAPEWKPGYLHIYQANRPLKLLYIDGMGAAKCDFGPMDTQDLLLLNFTLHKFRDRERALMLCELAEEWGVEGFIRMETGFEIIKCDFSEGLDFISHKRRPGLTGPESINEMFFLEYMREASKRYAGIDGGRVELDYSSMVSALFYPVDLENPDQDPDELTLPRLISTNPGILHRIKSDLGAVLKGSRSHRRVDWQGVADMIVKRYADRLQFLATDPPQKTFLSEVNLLLSLFIDFESPARQDPIEACSSHFLRSVRPSTAQDHLIQAAFETVTHRICETLFDVREQLIRREEKDEREEGECNANASPVDLVRDLVKRLEWSEWKSCGECHYERICLIAMFPFGTAEDHYNPRCVNNTEVNQRLRGPNYWIGDRGR